jgi:putative FmdB family regulatory protein
MPLYEYECKKCGQTFEVIQKFSDEPLTKHPKCGGKVSKLISAAGLQFKGTGWYITDYARSGGAAPEKPDSSSKSDESAKPKTETAAKSDGAKSELTKVAGDSGKASKSSAKAGKKK